SALMHLPAIFFLVYDRARRYLHSFPTRRSSDLVRLLHLAGRPTYDVRALRTWLKSDESVDTVAFFILRGETDDPAATEQELALIDRKSTRLNSSHVKISYAVFCLKKKKNNQTKN